MNFTIPFSGRAHYYSSEEVDEVINVMQTAEPLTQGSYLKRFQSKFR